MAIANDKFIQIYGFLHARTWEDEALKQRFLKTPEAVLKEFGLDAGRAKVNIIKELENPAQFTAQTAADMWNTGLERGQIDFVYAQELPEEQTPGELTIQELESISGGGCCSCSHLCCCCSA